MAKTIQSTIQKKERFGKENFNNQGCLMKIIEYNSAIDVVVEFQDNYKARVHTNYSAFSKGAVENPYHTSVYNIGIKGNKYPSKINGKNTKEYSTWIQMMRRCFDEKEKKKCPTYKEVTCCDEWLNYENFYEWLHSQPNFEQWLNNDNWAIDKDILFKGNKVYSPETCCLVPQNINKLFTKHDAARGKYPIGVVKYRDVFVARCMNPFIGKQVAIGSFSNIINAFNAYKNYKEDIIKQIAQEEYNKSNITKQCYEAMMNYQVEITD